ncbi:MAG: hypothetical protein AB1941_26250 [Gemmatimonadota bacterium]
MSRPDPRLVETGPLPCLLSVPAADPGRPTWLSFGEVARSRRAGFLQRLGLRDAAEAPGADRVFTDRGEDHVGSATSAYREERVYRWLLSRRLPGPPA